MTAATPEEIAAIEAAELSGALSRLEKGQRLTAHERALVERFKSAGAAAAGMADPPPVLSSKELAARFKCTVRTIQRIQAVAELPGVPPVPWHDLPALREWYQRYYRSDLSKDATGKAALPPWLAPEPPSIAALSLLPAENGPVDVIGDMRLLVAAKRAAWQMSPDNAALQADYFAALTEFSAVEKRFLATGGSGYFAASKIEAALAVVHSRIVKRLAADLGALFPEVRKAMNAAGAEANYRALMMRAAEGIGRRLAETKFLETS